MESGSNLVTTRCNPKTHKGASSSSSSKDKISKWLPLQEDRDKTRSRPKLPSKLKLRRSNKSLNRLLKHQYLICQHLSQIPQACPSNRIRFLMTLNSKVFRLGLSSQNWESHHAHMLTISQKCAILLNRHRMPMLVGF